MALEAAAPVAPSAVDIEAALTRDLPSSRIRTSGLEAVAVDGVEPSVVVQPAHPDEAAAVVARCDELGAAVVPRGAGAQMGLGNVPERVDVVLDTTALNELVTYTPADLTLGVQAGVTLAALQARLREEGQHLPLDPPFAASATLGGLMATNTSGPRRVASGSFRDLVIGAETAGPDGAITKSGGMVVKNVTGYDLHKGHIGALGTLGLITRVNLKVAPLPTNERTAVYGYASALDAGGAVGSIVALPVAPTGVDLIDRRLVATADVPDRPWLLAARFAGTEAGVAAQLAMVHEALASNGAAPHALEGDAQRDFWRDAVSVAEPPPTGEPYTVCRMSALSSQIPSLLGTAAEIAAEHGLEWRAEAHAVSGVGRVRWTGGDDDAVCRAVSDLRGAAQLFDAPVVVEAAPPGVKRRLDVWGTDPSNAAHALAGELRRAFDPNRTLNPGRFLADAA